MVGVECVPTDFRMRDALFMQIFPMKRTLAILFLCYLPNIVQTRCHLIIHRHLKSTNCKANFPATQLTIITNVITLSIWSIYAVTSKKIFSFNGQNLVED